MIVLRAILALGRLSFLPTVWSNCLAGWWLGGGGHTDDVFFVLGGATCLWAAGALLNDAFDLRYDRQHRRTRPIPSGLVGVKVVWRAGLILLVTGTFLLYLAGYTAGKLGLALVCCIVLFNALHRVITLSPALMGIARLFLYLIGASVASRGVTGWSIWCGLALAVYVTGAGYFAGTITVGKEVRRWPVFLLAAPAALALVMNSDVYRESALLLTAVFALWTLIGLRYTLWTPDPDPARTVGSLVAGIVLVDWLAVPNAPRDLNFVFIGLFLATAFLQKVLPPKH
jgi:4-hydroxybenzoate polyprenyltransferase